MRRMIYTGAAMALAAVMAAPRKDAFQTVYGPGASQDLVDLELGRKKNGYRSPPTRRVKGQGGRPYVRDPKTGLKLNPSRRTEE